MARLPTCDRAISRIVTKYHIIFLVKSGRDQTIREYPVNYTGHLRDEKEATRMAIRLNKIPDEFEIIAVRKMYQEQLLYQLSERDFIAAVEKNLEKEKEISHE